jgi:hypothetical protein
MTLLWISLIWVFAAAGVAMLPMRRQYIPGVALMAMAPVLIILIGFQVGFIGMVAATAAFVSMFRNPLKYLWAKLQGQNPALPTDGPMPEGTQ